MQLRSKVFFVVSSLLSAIAFQVIKKFADVAKDPAKLAELKVVLNLLCHETSYETECKEFVSKLDLFIDKLLPYLVRKELRQQA